MTEEGMQAANDSAKNLLLGGPEHGPRLLNGDEIDLVALGQILRQFAQHVWLGRRRVAAWAGLGAVLGVLWGLGSQSEYNSTVRLLPYGQQGGSSLSGLSGLLGFRGAPNAFDRTITAVVYPDLLKSMDFRRALADRPLQFADPDTTVAFAEYFATLHRPAPTQILLEYTIGLPRLAKGVVGKLLSPSRPPTTASDSSRLVRLTRDESDVLDALEGRLAVAVDFQTGVVSLSAEMPDPVAAASLADEAARLLMEAAISYESQKASEELKYVEERLRESDQRLASARGQLVRFLESNRNIGSAQLQMVRQTLEEQLAVEVEVNRQLATERSQTLLKKSRDTPVFTLIQRAAVPLDRVRPNRTLLAMAGLLMGFFAGLLHVRRRLTEAQGG